MITKTTPYNDRERELADEIVGWFDTSDSDDNGELEINQVAHVLKAYREEIEAKANLKPEEIREKLAEIFVEIQYQRSQHALDVSLDDLVRLFMELERLLKI